MATDTSEAELVHPKALPLRVGAQLIHADKLGEVEENTMPIRRAVNSTRETPPKSKLAEGEEEKPEPDVSSEESASTGEEQENETPPATSSETEQPKEVEKEEKGENKPSEETKKDEKDQTKEKEKKVKKTIPSWATLSASQLARAQKQTHMAASSRPKMDAILTEAIKACFQKTGASVVAIRKYIIHKYPSLELERRGYLLKQALKRELQRGVIRQVKGKGASGSFVVVPNAGKTVQKSKDRKKSSSTLAPEQQVKLEDVLPLAFTRLCEPKEASYSLIRKYVSQYYPKLKVDIRPQLLKNALQRAVEKGQLEQITGKGASGTFQLKRSGEKPLLGGSLMEDAILSAIAAMNEPKTCSTTALKKYVLENHPGTNSNFQVHLLKRTLQKCEKNGWMEQISGKGFSGTFQLCFPYYPSPGVLFPEKQQSEESEESEDDDSEEEDEEDSSEEEESEDDEPPPKKRLQKKAPAKSRGKATSAKQRDSKPKPKTPAAQRGKARPPPKKAPPKAKTPTKKTKPAPPAIKKSGSISSKKPAASGKKDGKSSTKGKSRKSLRAKK
ncbi:heterochromatin protein 1-binding protein 3 isoform X1 [Phascolarctos cinereus]|uniref:Heterochromatin protein 1-binding protein 3 n=2 Tax=Phascolarctos cinereus TaxID=38626 RepID=A0A6P5JCC3_PHACI|nr:heterochromatin protein 1-binding protein 3 isoform X1 [Phascolarctos cinereus]XP_020828785.1 heterochromatin protein 1-binding protein 3 isoform X1 [Phascolarctos cinereus]XP_020828786.1 heterochromatin protein 1-binding protein 3 isoform X1 [Phascolarctos cinereus]